MVGSSCNCFNFIRCTGTSASDSSPYKDTEVLLIRCCAEARDGEDCAEQFRTWHSERIWKAGRDPCLNELGAQAAGTGAVDEAYSGSLRGAHGLKGGLYGLLQRFQPELVVTSPMSTSVQTTLLAVGKRAVPVIVHPALAHVQDRTRGGRFPEGKPKLHGLSAVELEAALSSLTGVKNKFDLSLLGESHWYDKDVKLKDLIRQMQMIPLWLAQRAEQRIAVISHGAVLKRITGCKIGHGQYVRANITPQGDLYSRPSVDDFGHEYSSDDNSPYLQSSPHLISSVHAVSLDLEQPMRVLCIRHCEDEVAGDGDRRPASKFSGWHPSTFRQDDLYFGGMRDPCLSERGVQEAGAGIPDETLRLKMNMKGYGGLPGGLRRKAKEFGAELILCSPLARAIQTALVMFDESSAALLAHPKLKEVSKKGYAPTWKHPMGKPGSQGIGGKTLQHALYKHPRSSGAFADASLVPEHWFDPHESWDGMRRGVSEFVAWLKARPERRIAIVSHGGFFKEWLKVEMSHGQYVEGVLAVDDDDDACHKFLLTKFSSGVQLYVDD
eukprot:TRINITY_DN71595_c0_g1_i1.p1 TRINITY_DN71595_c0_g1~~TRINITY_DN71595_c0_g1_i1.p1  ORF type:complete len:570 (+),score=72.35 TRINITY_DN71595_c0_g1_i1:57-1712(+)